MRARRTDTRTLYALAVWICAGCAAGEPEVDTPSNIPVGGSVPNIAAAARAAGYESQYELLKDGDASKSDYEEATAQAVACMKEAGLQVVEPVELDKSDSLSLMISADMGNLPMDEASDLMVECLDSKVAYVEEAYLSTHEPVMDPALLAESIGCLSAAGIELAGNEKSLTDLREAAGEDQFAVVNDCVGESLQKVYPGSSTNLSG